MGKDVELCRMKQWQVLKTIFPEVITENFEFVDYQESADRLDYWLDERDTCRARIIRKVRCASMALLMSA